MGVSGRKVDQVGTSAVRGIGLKQANRILAEVRPGEWVSIIWGLVGEEFGQTWRPSHIPGRQGVLGKLT